MNPSTNYRHAGNPPRNINGLKATEIRAYADWRKNYLRGLTSEAPKEYPHFIHVLTAEQINVWNQERNVYLVTGKGKLPKGFPTLREMLTRSRLPVEGVLV